jgi:ABC-type branched-subunit amino acid transport system substrate-binding protein
MLSVLRVARKSLGHLAAAAAALVLAACGETGTPAASGPALDTSRPVQVALLVPGGSGQPSDELLARSLENAARLAIADLGGVQIDLRVYNTAGSPANAAAMASQAVAEGAKIILGPVYAQEANAAGLAVAPAGVNVLAFSNNPDVAGGNVFVLGPTFDNTAGRLAAYAVRQGKGQVMIIQDQNTAGDLGRAAIQRGVAAAGGTVVAVGTYEFSQNGVVSAAPGLVAQAKSSGAQSVFLTADTAGALPLITQMLVDSGLDPAATRFIGLTRWDIPSGTLDLPGVQGGWFALPDPGMYQTYRAHYQAAYAEEPHPISGLAYDGIAAIGALIRQGNAQALSAAGLTQGAGFVGVNGIFRLRADGTNERGLAVAQVQDRQMVIVDPAPRSFGGAGF